MCVFVCVYKCLLDYIHYCIYNFFGCILVGQQNGECNIVNLSVEPLNSLIPGSVYV